MKNEKKRIQGYDSKEKSKQYEIITVQDIFSILTDKNINKFMREFKQAMKIGIALREITKALDLKDNDALKMPSFTWIDD
jgi:hypothetical protein